MNSQNQTPLVEFLSGRHTPQNVLDEHAALVAVAEAAKLISEGDVMRLNPSFTHADTVLSYQKLMRQALANLAAVQKGAGK